MILVDTNVLLRSVQPSHSMHSVATSTIADLTSQGETLCLVPQVLYEFWVVATRPVEQNGLGMTAVEADADVAKLLQQFRLARDERGIFDPWRRIVFQHSVLGKNAHDARLVAAMQRHRIARIVTFNVRDFKRFPGISIIDPVSAATP